MTTTSSTSTSTPVECLPNWSTSPIYNVYALVYEGSHLLAIFLTIGFYALVFCGLVLLFLRHYEYKQKRN